MIKINQNFTNELIVKAQNSVRRRTIYNFHKELSDTLQRMLNVMNKDTYVQPHKHENPDKREAFIILKGKVLVIEFDNSGNLVDYILLSREHENYGCEIAPGTWHTIICLEDNSIIYEVKDGPYVQETDKQFADWAPEEGNKTCLDYNAKLIQNLLS
ncbi:MAG: WbuC family cupin fold metalloprotein [Bacteroidales bacterium]|nr:WbuC family cupin fold metalloprotein [Bacteroidales bacterium]